MTIPAQGHLLLVQGDLAAFRSTYHVPADVQIGAYSVPPPQVDGEPLELSRPSGSAGGVVRHVTVDQVRYTNRPPWPTGADGSGDSPSASI
jgi:hypothetical protein